jgi:alpha-galactosidase
MQSLSVKIMVSACACFYLNSASVSNASWQKDLFAFPYGNALAESNSPMVLEVLRQDYEKLERNESVTHSPLVIGSHQFKRGLGTHTVSKIRLYSPETVVRFCAYVGINKAGNSGGSAIFSVLTDKKLLYKSKLMLFGQEPEYIDIDASSSHELTLFADDGGDGPAFDHAVWAQAAIILKNGKTVWLDDIKSGTVPKRDWNYPFSFTYGQKRESELLAGWQRTDSVEKLDQDRSRRITSWLDKKSNLKVTFEAIEFLDFPAVDWLLYFENTGDSNTAVIEDVQSLEYCISEPMGSRDLYRFYKTNGSPANPTDFAASQILLKAGDIETLSGGFGRSSSKDMPFFKIENGRSSYIFAVGWTGQWQSSLVVQDDASLRVRSGLEKTHFYLRPGEKVRMPRILMINTDGDTWNCNTVCRELIFKHYACRRNGRNVMPTPFCNTCFTRGGLWLNETTAENQISLIKAYSKIGIELLLTDAGWFEGGWPAGAGNWTPRKDSYPEGMAPVAKAAKDCNMIYGLWFEPERVVAGTWLHKNHPDWLLRRNGDNNTFLLNFALPQAREYFFSIVAGYMRLPGFGVYRQDFNAEPFDYWRDNDAPDRQGITEIKYIEGLYEYWDMLAKAWPDSFREGCSSGGRRIDLETIMRFHASQKTDYWFDPEVDQASLWGLSQYLPNSVVVAHLRDMDDYTFHSTLPSSICLGWIADAPGFDLSKAAGIISRYKEIRELMVGAWYPLTDLPRDKTQWLVSQYHRRDLNRGCIIALRRPESKYRSLEVTFHGLDADAYYDISGQFNKGEHIKGSQLMSQFVITLDRPRQSDLIIYQRSAK